MARPKRVKTVPHLLEFRRSRGLTQDQVAERIGITVEMVRRHERGDSLPIALYRARYGSLYGATEERLGFRRKGDLDPKPALTECGDPAHLNASRRRDSHCIAWPENDHDWRSLGEVADLVNQVTQSDLALNRRELGRLFTSVVVGPELLERMERWLTVPVGPPPTGDLASVGYEEVVQIENTARVFRNWDDQFGGGLRRKAVVGQLNELSDTVSDRHPPEITRRLHVAMAELSETAAMMSWDSGHQAAAQRYYLIGLHAARAADDPAFAANIMAGMARQLLYLGRPSDALELVRLAQDRFCDRATASVRSMLYAREAWAYSQLGRVAAFERATGNAENALACARPAEDPHWIEYFDTSELHGTTGGRLLELAYQDKRYAAAATERIKTAVATRRPGRLRSSALDEIGLAEALLIRGELDQAARAGHEAIDSASDTSSDRVHVQLTHLSSQVQNYLDVPDLRSLRDRLMSKQAPTNMA